MTPEQEQRLEKSIAGLSRQSIDRTADTIIFIEIISEIVAELRGQDVKEAKKQLIQRVLAKEKQTILEIERVDPGYAAWVDERRGIDSWLDE